MADTTIKLSGTYDSIEAYKLLEEMRGVASDYLPLTGGEISGDLIVDGQLSADLTGNVTGTASGNLPLSGGTMTGTITSSVGVVVKKSTDDSYIQFNSGTETANGASLIMCGKDYSGSYGAGTFVLNSKDANTNKALVGKTDGTLTWGGTNLLIPSINIKAGTTSAITVAGNSSGTVSVSFGITFPSTPKVVACCSIGYQGTYASVTAVSATSCTIRLTNTSSSSYSLKADWIAIAI